MKPVIALAAAAALTFAAAQVMAQSDVPPVPGASSPSFDQVDSDADGQISREEAAAAGISLDWDNADSDGSGSLSQDEYDSASDPGSSMPSDPGMGSDPDMGSDPGATDGGL
ncbi:MAG: hypothetical protein RBT81_04530 [Gammaproteobacteria bacterium]|nr:hypothetical protein [Gammaproteobacteria bacterium]